MDVRLLTCVVCIIIQVGYSFQMRLGLIARVEARKREEREKGIAYRPKGIQ